MQQWLQLCKEQKINANEFWDDQLPIGGRTGRMDPEMRTNILN